MIKTIPKEKIGRKVKGLFEKVLEIAENRRKVKNKEEREKYTKLNAEFQKITRRDKKAFFSEQCKAIEETNQ